MRMPVNNRLLTTKQPKLKNIYIYDIHLLSSMQAMLFAASNTNNKINNISQLHVFVLFQIVIAMYGLIRLTVGLLYQYFMIYMYIIYAINQATGQHYKTLSFMVINPAFVKRKLCLCNRLVSVRRQLVSYFVNFLKNLSLLTVLTVEL